MKLYHLLFIFFFVMALNTLTKAVEVAEEQVSSQILASIDIYE